MSQVDTNAADIITVSGLTGGGSSLTVQDVDGSPSVSNVTTIRVTNGSLTDNGGGTVTTLPAVVEVEVEVLLILPDLDCHWLAQSLTFMAEVATLDTQN